MKNDCLFKCLKEVGLDKFYETFINNGITTCDHLTKISIQSFPNFGIIEVEDKLKLFELIKIIKSIQADLIKEYEAKDRLKIQENLLSNKQSNQDIVDRKEFNDSRTDSKSIVSDLNESSKAQLISNSKDILSPDINNDFVSTNNDKAKSSENSVDQYSPKAQKKETRNRNTLNSTYQFLTVENKPKTSINGNKNQFHIKTKQLKSNHTDLKSPAFNKFHRRIPQLKSLSPAVNKKAVDCNFRPDEIQLSSTPLKPLNTRPKNSSFNKLKQSNIVQSTSNNLRVKNLKEDDELEVISGHSLLFSRSAAKRSLSSLLNEDAPISSERNNIDAFHLVDTNEHSQRRRNTFDKLADQSLPLKYLNKSTDNLSNKNLEPPCQTQLKPSQSTESEVQLTQQIISLNHLSLDNKEPIQSVVTDSTDDLHLETSVYFKPIKSSQITTSSRPTNESHSSIQNSKTSDPIAIHENQKIVSNVDENRNINSNISKLDVQSTSSSIFTSNGNQFNDSTSLICDTLAVKQCSTQNKCTCVGCLETAHEQQLGEVTRLSSLEMDILISYKQQRISEDEYVETLKKLLKEKFDYINNLLILCDQFQRDTN